MKKIIKRAVALLLILCLVLSVVYLADRVLLIKRYDGVKPMQALYAQMDNSIDLLLMGNSHMGVHVDTATLWQEYGISAFALWGGVQPMWNTYHYLVEALKTQSPKAVVLEVGGLSYTWEYADEATQLKNVAGMKLSRNKLQSVKASAPGDRQLNLLLGLPLYHQRYGEISREDFQYFPWSKELAGYKGSFALYGHGNFDFADAADFTDVAELSDKSLDYFYRIVSLCESEGIELVLVKTPTVDMKLYQPVCNAVEQIAKEEGLSFYNFNLMYGETGILPEDFYFDTHLSLTGARKLSRSLVDVLKTEGIEFSDHRGESGYESWDENARRINDEYLLSITEAEDYIAELQRGGREVLLIKNGDWQKREPWLSFASELSALGVTEEELLCDGSGAWYISDVSSGAVSENTTEFYLDNKKLFVDFDSLNAVTDNGSIVYSFHNIGITMLVYDGESDALLDKADFLHTDYFALSRK